MIMAAYLSNLWGIMTNLKVFKSISVPGFSLSWQTDDVEDPVLLILTQVYEYFLLISFVYCNLIFNDSSSIHFHFKCR